MIYGENNSGKSNILKFLNLIFSQKNSQASGSIMVEGETEVIDSQEEKNFYSGLIDGKPYIFHKNIHITEIVFEFVIKLTHSEINDSGYDYYDNLVEDYFSKTQSYCTLKFSGRIKSIDQKTTSEIILDNVKLNNKDIYSSEHSNNYFKDSKELLGNRLAFQTLLGLLNNSVLFIDNNRYFIKEKQTKKNNKLSSVNYKNWMSHNYFDPFKYKRFQELLKFIRSSKVGKLKALSELDLSFSINGNELEIMLNNGSERLPIDSFGTGVSQLLYLLTQLFFTNSRIILIEELELNLSNKTQREFFKVLRELINKKVIDQVFFTTHSKAFNFRNDFSVYEVDISNNGVSSVKHMTNGPRKNFFVSTLID
tara:strand:+ start:4279 stop:5376 length:1098 start_codon:yes stop_codon:yes gene_type:complete